MVHWIPIGEHCNICRRPGDMYHFFSLDTYEKSFRVFYLCCTKLLLNYLPAIHYNLIHEAIGRIESV